MPSNHPVLCLGTRCQQVPASACQNLKGLHRDLHWAQLGIWSTCSQYRAALKAESLQMAPTLGSFRRVYLSRTRREWGPWLSHQLGVCGPLHNLPNLSSPQGHFLFLSTSHPLIWKTQHPQTLTDMLCMYMYSYLTCIPKQNSVGLESSHIQDLIIWNIYFLL